MFPLAEYILKDWCKPKHLRSVVEDGNIRPALAEATFFDVTEIGRVATSAEVRKASVDVLKNGNEHIFLPAPVVWFEYDRVSKDDQYIHREGLLASQDDDENIHYAICTMRQDVFFLYNAHSLMRQPQGGYELTYQPNTFLEPKPAQLNEISQVEGHPLLCLLLLINTPRLTGQTAHKPNTVLQRRLSKAKGTGKFQPYTKITLHPKGEQSDAEVEASYTGSRRLHFVRSFIRWRQGKMQRVKAHWRGDASLGTKDSTYKVKL